MLEVTYSMHIVYFWERLFITSEVEALINCIEFKRILSKVGHPYGSLDIQNKKRQEL